MSPRRKKIWVSSRQAGKSFALSFLATYEALKKADSLVLCISTGSRASEELLKKCVKMAEAVQVLSDGTMSFTSSSDTVKFQNGSRIISLPSGNVAALRGWTSDATIIDEAAFIENADEVFEAIVPTLTRNPKSKLILASTPAGCQGKFYDIWTSGEDWYKQQTTIEDAISEGLRVNLTDLHNLVPDPEQFAQEFQCHFSKEYGAMLDPEVLQFYEDIPEGTDGVYFSADIGRQHDRSSIVIMKTKKDMLYVDDVIMLNKCEYQKQLDIFKELNLKYHFNGGYIDATGIGSAVAEFANRQISVKIKPWTFTASNKTTMYERIRDKVFQRKILFSEKFKTLIKQDFRNVQRIVTESGQVKFQAGSNDEGHSDFVSSLALNLQAEHDMPVQAKAPVTYQRTSAFGGVRHSMFS